ncbi:MAG: anthranilate phosphoribosyltransferase family protein [Synechococcus sp.]|nr:anthranilate phosphoribosyltransferase family protein [Synechococcus sp.]
MPNAAPPARSGRELFKDYLRKVGSGEHTSKGLSRSEAAHALELILDQQASPAQIGAFLIAHRIRRPEPQELTGMLDVYRQRGPQLRTEKTAISFGMPFDGRTRTAPIYPLTALVLAAAGVPVVLQGGQRMPVKYGITAQELFAALGVQWAGRSLSWVQQMLDDHQLALVHQPDHFPAAETLISYREDLGKRPPVASLELLWSAHQGEHLLVSGFVHPPTEARAWEALSLGGEAWVYTVKGLEGSTDLPISRACVTGLQRAGQQQRLILHPRDHGCFGQDMLWSDLAHWTTTGLQALGGQGELADSLCWNSGVYLWQMGLEPDLARGLERSRELIHSGAALQLLEQLRQR